MGWPEFLEKARDHFQVQDGVDLRLGYRFTGSYGEPRSMSQLDCEFDWTLVMQRLRDKAESPRRRNPVALNIKNLVSDAFPT